MIHLTLSGAFAGWLVCDCDKEQARAQGDTFQHYMFADIYLPDICPACFALAQQNEEEDEEEEEEGG